MGNVALKDQWPLRLIIGAEDCTYLLDDNFTCSRADPGGFEAASFSLPRDMPQTLRGTYVRMDCGLGVAFEGRVKEVQRSLGSKTAIQCEGFKALLSDNDGSMVFVDRDLTQWQGPSYSRQIALISGTAAGYGLGLGSLSSQIAADPTNNLPALILSGTWPWSGAQAVEAWYDSGPENLISEIYAEAVDQITSPAYLVTDSPPNTLGIGSSSDDLASFASWTGAIPAYDTAVTVATTAYRWGWIQLLNSGGYGGGTFASGDTAGVALSNIAVYGNHGLVGQGPDPEGFYPSQMAGWVIGQVPGLQPGVIPVTDATGYIMPHSVYYTPVPLATMIDDFAKAAGWHWGVWEALSPLTGNATPRVDFRPRPALGQWSAFCLRRDCTTCDVREDIAQQYNKCVVTFTDVAGVNGAAVATMDNPILDAAGIASRTMNLNGGTMTPGDAGLFAQIVLAYAYSEARVAGSIQIDQTIDGPAGPAAAWMLKPGIDRLRIGDLPSTDAWGAYNDVPVQRVELSGSSSGFSTSVEVGIGASLVETLQARLSAASALAAVGG